MKLSAKGGGNVGSPGLKQLKQVKLNPRNRAVLKSALKHCGGSPPIRNRKQAEAFELLAMSQIAPAGRLAVEGLDLRENLRAMLALQVPVACQPKSDNELVLFNRALVGFTYPNEGFQRPLPGHAFFQIMLPRNVWLAQVKQPEQVLCIAPQVPAGTRTAMLLLRLYGALSMQSIQVDIQDAAGVFNPDIAYWWQNNLDRVPLTTTAFFDSSKA